VQCETNICVTSWNSGIPEHRRQARQVADVAQARPGRTADARRLDIGRHVRAPATERLVRPLPAFTATVCPLDARDETAEPLIGMPPTSAELVLSLVTVHCWRAMSSLNAFQFRKQRDGEPAGPQRDRTGTATVGSPVKSAGGRTRLRSAAVPWVWPIWRFPSGVETPPRDMGFATTGRCCERASRRSKWRASPVGARRSG